MLPSWNGYLVRTLNQLASAYHAVKPSYYRSGKAASGNQERRKGLRGRRKSLSVEDYRDKDSDQSTAERVLRRLP